MDQLNERGIFYNPVAEAFDPVITTYKGRYYLIGTSRGNHLAIQTADSLAGLGSATPHIIYSGCGTDLGCCTLWSPVLQYLRGRWYVYFSTTNSDHTQWADYVLEGSEDDPLGPYQFKASLRQGSGPKAIIGPSAFELPDGRLFFTTTTFGFYIQPMLNPWTLTGSLVTIDDGRPTYDWEGGTSEVSRAIVHTANGKTTVCAPYTTENYVTPRTDGAPAWSWCVGMFINTGGDILNPACWRKSEQPVFAGGPESGLFTIMAINVFKSPDEQEDWFVYNGLDVLDDWFGDRDSFVKRFTWNEDGLPEFGVPTPLAQPVIVPSGEPEAVPVPPPGALLLQDQLQPLAGTVVLAGEPGWGDYHLELNLTASRQANNSGCSIHARMLDPEHGYAFTITYLDGAELRWRLIRQDGGTTEEMASGITAWQPGQPVQLRLTLNNERITAAVKPQGEPWVILTSLLDNIYAYGKIGIKVWGQDEISVSPIKVVKELPTWGMYTGPGWHETSLNAGLADRRALPDNWVDVALGHEANQREEVTNLPFRSDRWFVGGHSRRPQPAPSIDLSACPAPAPEQVYQSERWSEKRFAYLIPSLHAGKEYRLRLHFAELVYTQPGQRTFNVSVNGQLLLCNFDKVAEAGGLYRALSKQFLVQASPTGQLLIEFSRGSVGDGEPTVSGIEVASP